MVGPGGLSARGGVHVGSESEHVCLVIAVVGEAKEIPVAAEAGAGGGRDLEAAIFGPHQDLSGVDGAGGEDDVLGVKSKLVSRMLVFVVAAVDAPAASIQFLDPFHFSLGEDLGAGVFGHGQVVHVHGVFGADVAAGDAIAAVGTRLLVYPVRVLAVQVEVDRDVEWFSVHADLAAAPLESLDLEQLLRPRVLVCSEDRVRLLVVRRQLIEADARRPAVFVEGFRVGNDGDVGVHERRAAEAGAFDDRDVLVVHQLVQAQAVGLVVLVRQRLVEAIRESSHLPLQAAFQNADGRLRGEVRRRQARRGDGAAVAGAHHHVVILRFSSVPVFGKHPNPSVGYLV